MKQDFLFELGCEELPAGDLAPMAEHLKRSIQKSLEAAKFEFGAIQTHYAPRRLAVLIEELQVEKAAETIERRGPAKVAGFDASGNPSKALEGFLKSCNATVNDVLEVETDKGVWFAVKLTQAAQKVKTVLPTIVAEAVKTLPMKKAMRWGKHDFAFLRPVHWIVALLGEEVVPVKLFNLEAGDASFGHRFHHPGTVKIKQPKDYLNTLRKAHVMADQTERREVIVTETNALMSKGLSAHFGKLDEVINLVEWPVALLCHFEKEFLSVPKEVLIATMEANQRVFPVHNNQQELQNSFVVITNIASKDPAEVIHGNEKVVRARLSDAKFFYDEDLKIPLAHYLEALEKITFQQGLGTVLDKTTRLEGLVTFICHFREGGNPAASTLAAHLCKADLCTQMVQEFPELQGYMGHQYALVQNVDPKIAEAIEDHYKPKGRGAELPRNEIGAALALADKIDTLVGMFAIGKEPTSSGDPFALRRQALGVIAILVGKSLHLDLLDVFKKAYANLKAQGHQLEAEASVIEKLTRFIKERFEVWCREEGNLPVGVVRAILNRNSDASHLNVFDIYQRIQVLQSLLQTEAGDALKELAKRIHNILGDKAINGEMNAKLFGEAEQSLAQTLKAVPEWASQDLETHYRGYLALGEPIAQFFDAVLVNDEDVALRLNRQLLLQQAKAELSKLADFSKL